MDSRFFVLATAQFVFYCSFEAILATLCTSRERYVQRVRLVAAPSCIRRAWFWVVAWHMDLLVSVEDAMISLRFPQIVVSLFSALSS